MKQYRIRPLAMSYCEIDTGVFTYRCNYGKKVKSTSYMWYIEGANQTIIVDGGSDAKLRADFRGSTRGVDIMSFEDALKKVGLKPENVDMVIQTHLQWDHVGNTQKFHNAKVVVQKDELEFAFSPNPILAPTYAVNLLKGLNYEVVDGYHEIEPGIDLIPSPGHTPGCQSVSVNTEKGRAIIAGFCCVNANFEPPEDMKTFIPVVPCGTHTDPMLSLKSAIQIKEMADILIPSHDYSLVDVESIP